jgi:hypothetical protein
MMNRRIEDFKNFSLLEAYFPETPSPNSRMNEAAYKKMRACIFYLNAQYPFFAGLLSRLVIRENNTRKTMSTDGYSIHYNSEFVLKHTEPEIIWVVAHEVMHNALLHFSRCPKDNAGAKLWNIAADYALNQMITEVDQDALANGKVQPSKNPKNSVGKMPEEALYPGCKYIKGDDKFVNMTAEQIYAELKKIGFTPPDDTTPPPPPPPPAPPQEPKVGDVIYDTENQNYGIITKYDPNTGDVEYDPIPKDKVREYLK